MLGPWDHRFASRCTFSDTPRGTSAHPMGCLIPFLAMQQRTRPVLSFVLALVMGGAAFAQQPPSALPENPQPKQEQSDQSQPKNPLAASLGLIAKRSYVFPEIAFTPGPLTPTQKFKLFLNRSTSPSQIFSSVAGAGIGQASDSLSGYGQGWNGYGKRFGSSLASSAASNFFGTYLLSSMLREDPRYFVKLTGGWKGRVGHALARVVVIRTDVGGYKFNVPQTLGPLMAEGLANVYLPQGERTAGKTFTRFGIRIGWGAAGNLVREYWADIFKDLRINKVVPELKPTPPVTPPGETPQH